MPMNPANYPPNWAEISKHVRFERAEGRCECTGECASIRHELTFASTGHRRCPAIHGQRSPYSTSRVVLTTAHLDQDPASDDTSRMLAMCQSCHLAYDKLPEQAARRAAIKQLASAHERGHGDAAEGRQGAGERPGAGPAAGGDRRAPQGTGSVSGRVGGERVPAGAAPADLGAGSAAAPGRGREAARRATGGNTTGRQWERLLVDLVVGVVALSLRIFGLLVTRVLVAGVFRRLGLRVDVGRFTLTRDRAAVIDSLGLGLTLRVNAVGEVVAETGLRTAADVLHRHDVFLSCVADTSYGTQLDDDAIIAAARQFKHRA